jgi:hypothetical protein
MLFSSRAVDFPVTFYRNLDRLCGLLRRDRSYPSRRCRLAPAPANPRPCQADSATAAATTTAAAAAPKDTASASAASMESTATMTAATQTAMATAATMAASAATAMAAASAAMAATTAAATGQFQVLGEWGCSAVFLVKDIERRQANVEDFLFAEKDFLILTL